MILLCCSQSEAASLLFLYIWCVYLCVFQCEMALLLFDDRMARVMLVARLCVWASERVLKPPTDQVSWCWLDGIAAGSHFGRVV
jgi:hypothetical protein